MGNLKKARGEKAFPSVSEILDDIKEVITNGNAAKVITNDDSEFYYLLNIEEDIEEEPSDFKVVWSTKRKKAFIMAKDSDSWDF